MLRPLLSVRKLDIFWYLLAAVVNGSLPFIGYRALEFFAVGQRGRLFSAFIVGVIFKQWIDRITAVAQFEMQVWTTVATCAAHGSYHLTSGYFHIRLQSLSKRIHVGIERSEAFTLAR